MGFTTIQWDVDPRDWARPGTNAIYQNVIDNTRPGAIVIQHDGGGDRSQTLAALPHESTPSAPGATSSSRSRSCSANSSYTGSRKRTGSRRRPTRQPVAPSLVTPPYPPGPAESD